MEWLAQVSISCRVLPLEPAPAFLSQVLRSSSPLGAPARACLIKNSRNGPCHGIFSTCGFRLCASAGSGGGGGSSATHELSHESSEALVASVPCAREEMGEEWVLDCLDHLPDVDAEIYQVKFCTDLEI